MIFLIKLVSSDEGGPSPDLSSPLERSQSDQDLTRLSISSLDKVRHHSSPDALNSDYSGEPLVLEVAEKIPGQTCWQCS